MAKAQAQPLILEAEHFRPRGKWERKAYGENYYAATFANTFLSRKAFLGAPEQCKRSAASLNINIPHEGSYVALVRYEAAYHFQTQFRVQITQAGTICFDRLYGARDNVKIWAFGAKITNEVAWSWGASENIVWEGHDARVRLQAGPAELTLIAEEQPEPAARRNIDVIMLTTDEAEVQRRIQKEGYLPFDGLLTQEGDLYFRVENHGSNSVVLEIPPGTEHSPYWVHQRTWKPKQIETAPKSTSDWAEVGSLLDSLNDGQWNLSLKGKGPAQFALQAAVPEGKRMRVIRTFSNLTNAPTLAYEANTRAGRRLRTELEALKDLVESLETQRVHGAPPRRTLIYGTTFPERPHDPNYSSLLRRFKSLIGATALVSGGKDDLFGASGELVRGYIDVREKSLDQLQKLCAELKQESRADKIAVVSLGDEIGLPSPPSKAHEGFRTWLQGTGIAPERLGAARWEDVLYKPDRNIAATNTPLFYYSQLYRNRYGIAEIKKQTDLLRKHLPNAGIGANFSPHHGHFYLGETYKWVSLFREEGMTMPWSEDYIFQVPVGSQQMNFLSLDLFRAGIRNHPEAKIHFYVMPHWPGNTPSNWRRQFYGDLAHGAKILNLFEFRPVQAAYTENHVSSPDMYQEIRRSFHELGLFEDIIQEGSQAAAKGALWFSETGDIWNDNRAPFDGAKRTLYIAALHQQLGLDVVVEGDDLKGYEVLFLADQHVSHQASQAIANWVRNGGKLLATAGAGMFDEFNQPNKVMRELLGIDQQALIEPPEHRIHFEKQDLPFAAPIEQVQWRTSTIPVFSARSQIVANGAEVLGKFNDGSPALTRRSEGKGEAYYCAFLPGLSYFHPALPKKPVDRGSRDDNLCHFIPSKFDRGVTALLENFAAGVQRPIHCSNPLVEATLVQAPTGSVIILNNWSGQKVPGLSLYISNLRFANVERASGGRVRVWKEDRAIRCLLDLDVADALIFR